MPPATQNSGGSGVARRTLIAAYSARQSNRIWHQRLTGTFAGIIDGHMGSAVISRPVKPRRVGGVHRLRR
jgi:hypothetical protein